MQLADKSAAQQAAQQQSVKLGRDQLRCEIQLAEQRFRDLQERYDLFVMRHYGQRYQPWFEEASDRYRIGIRKRYFYLLKLEKQLQELIDTATSGIVKSSEKAATSGGAESDRVKPAEKPAPSVIVKLDAAIGKDATPPKRA